MYIYIYIHTYTDIYRHIPISISICQYINMSIYQYINRIYIYIHIIWYILYIYTLQIIHGDIVVMTSSAFSVGTTCARCRAGGPYQGVPSSGRLEPGALLWMVRFILINVESLGMSINYYLKNMYPSMIQCINTYIYILTYIYIIINIYIFNMIIYSYWCQYRRCPYVSI